MEYYIYSDLGTAQEALSVINNWCPVVGLHNGIPAPDKQQTICWIPEPLLMLSGEYAIPRLPDSRLEAAGELLQDDNGKWQYAGVPQSQIDSFMENYGQDIRTLSESDFPVSEDNDD